MKCWHDGNIDCLADCELVENCPDRWLMLNVRANIIEEVLDRLDEGVCEFCEHATDNHTCYKFCKNNEDNADYEKEAFIKWLKDQK